MSKNNPQGFLPDDGCMMKTVKVMQIILVGLCVVVFLVLLSLYGAKTIRSVDPVRMELNLSTDSTEVVSLQAKQLADSLISEIQKQETILEDKYRYFIEQQSNTQDLLTVGSVILGIIVSLVGFFGISTMKSIEDKARKIGEESAKEAFNKRLSELQDKRYNELMKDKFNPEINRQIKESLSKFEGDKSSSIDNHERRLNILEESISSLSIKVKNYGEKGQSAAEEPKEYAPKQEPEFFNNQSKQ